MAEIEIVENGTLGSPQSPILPPLELHPEQRLGGGALRRLSRLQQRVEGATEVAQAAINAHTVVRQTYEQAFLAACEDAQIFVPPGPHDVDIDWASGEVRFILKATP